MPFTSDRTLPSPDHQASLEPQELNQLVRQIRDLPKLFCAQTSSSKKYI
ncbi:hypothetical protein CEP10_09080 [Cylindrospermopsis raciborskii S07]|uniref:N-acetylneuraminate synthase family protein n=2 Tax=Cylindrospermopsis raciborskii TaxID=77022 RepID=A0A838WHV4_9CYAN|nr:N-acetylneuraminate synthase family protein [Cylindrospermopsis raciborskii]MBA4445023.1 N-acetylneuraminate synthase family protein [Cylindrospermopsis raciborskii CS-506_C]MBA4449243.1 N-acetylneuraminate synthase family protein [Cylindrospermopsis raciborskii CS-506_D]MBA4455883.1 N-acetylneuraminate synthase family protein [Cylindrospermopsis raciborskii CS-506_B]MBA4465226.1 N-acetylneuraminate synthase family protein [Cylindrospermopsis raciborskii CS-506_A]PNJ90802.1 hypothetical pro